MDRRLRNKCLGLLEAVAPLLGDRAYLKLKFPLMLGYRLNLRNPRTFNEKLQWLKLKVHDPLYTSLVDKAAVKEYVAGKIGKEHLIPTLGVWENFDEMDFAALPEQFVLKCTHDSGSAVICRDRKSFDIPAAKSHLESCLKKDFYRQSREWPYHDVPRRIIAEPYISALDGTTKDYKFFCFNGRPAFMFIASDRYSEGRETKFDFFDMDFNFLDFRNGHPNSDVLPAKPFRFEEMKQLAAMLSEGIPQVRIDFYEIDSKVLFGEYTFCHWGGLVPFEPAEWDLKLGEMLELPEI